MKYFLKCKKKIVSLLFSSFTIIFPVFLLYIIRDIIYRKSTKINENLSKNRKLFSDIENKKSDYICAKANNDLFSLYQKETYDDDVINDDISMKNSTLYLFKYLEEKDNIYLKKYIFTFIFEISLGVFIIVIIIVWIGLCYNLSRKKCCCFDCNKKQNPCYNNIIFYISITLFFVIIILNILIISHFYSFIQILNNSFCSLFKISYHTHFGEEQNYENRPKWAGISELKNILQKTENEIDNIINQNTEIYNMFNNDIKSDIYFELNNDEFVNNHINNFCDFSKYKVPNPNPLSDKNISNFLYCSKILNLIQNEYNTNFSKYILDIEDINNRLNSLKMDKNEIIFSLNNAKNKLDIFIKIISDLEIDYFDKSYFVFENIIHKYVIIIFYIIFFFILLILIVSVFTIISYKYCAYSNYCYKLYMFLWNIHMLMIIIIILISIAFSFSSSIMLDISIIIKYSLSDENINLNNTFFLSQALYDTKGIDICVNRDGNLEYYTQLDKTPKSLIHFYSLINLIKENLNNLINYKIIIEKNETQNIFDEIEEKVYLTNYQLNDNNYFENVDYFSPESILENVLNKYTNNENNQNIGNNSYFSNYIFVHSTEFCKANYNIINLDSSNCKNNCHYQKGKNCMLIKDFPDNDYFKGITINNLVNNENKDYYNLDYLTKEFKNKYYEIDKGFESSFNYFLINSKNYLYNNIEPKYNKIKNTMIKIFKIIDDKINIIAKLYENIIGKNNTDLFSAFNCKYLKRDINIFLNQIEFQLSRSFFLLSVYSLVIGLASLIFIIVNIIILKIYKMIANTVTKSRLSEVDLKDVDNSEKPKDIQEKIFEDDNKSTFNEKADFNKKNNHIKNNDKIKDKKKSFN